jgi:hypothetical protein
VTYTSDVALVINHCKHTDAVFGTECNGFYRIVVLQRRVSYKDKYGWTIPREGPEIGHFDSVIGAHDESKIVSVSQQRSNVRPRDRSLG